MDSTRIAGVKKPLEKQRIRKNRKLAAQDVDDIPQGVRDFLGTDNLDLFERGEDFGAVLPGGFEDPEKKSSERSEDD